MDYSLSSKARKEDMDRNYSGCNCFRTDVDVASIEKEHMFDKVVTPSDVGKLNRLVIPKQHAEKYFPLDSSTNEKDLLLNFVDRNGKPWRFRYSYWNSSQSYVITKGWSRFVKDKQLDAGDVVSFERGVGELGKDRLFIDWRHRPDPPAPDLRSAAVLHHHLPLQFQPWIRWSSRMVSLPCTPLPSMPVLQRRNQHLQLMKSDNHPYQSQQNSSMVIESVPVVQGKSAAKRLRLFGVNMDCPTSDELECNVLSSPVLPSHPLFPSSSFPPSQLRAHNETSPQEFDQEEFSDKWKPSN